MLQISSLLSIYAKLHSTRQQGSLRRKESMLELLRKFIDHKKISFSN